MSGKGDRPRPVDPQKFATEYERIFGQRPRGKTLLEVFREAGMLEPDESGVPSPHRFAEAD